MTARSHFVSGLSSMVAALTVTASLMAQEGAPPSAPPSAPPPGSQPQQTPPSSLDDLLDVDDEQPSAEAPAKPAQDEAAAAETKRQLDKQLSEAEVANAFVQAMEKMDVAADLLDVKFDTGLGTQRVQEDIIAKLAQLLDQAKKSKSSSSSSSSAQRQQQQQQQQNPGQRQQPQQPGDQNQRNQNPADNRSEIDPPAPEQANPNAALEETRSEWGSLPPRVREMLLQGRKEKFSTLYERLTYEYYKRLAEEGSP
jgi:hypothetical protein